MYANHDFNAVHRDVEDLRTQFDRSRQAKKQAESQSSSSKKKKSNLAFEKAEKEITRIGEEAKEHFKTLLQSPLCNVQKPGYGHLNLTQRKAARQLREYVGQITDPVTDDVIEETRELLKQFVRTVNPAHPFLQDEEEGDTAQGKNLAPRRSFRLAEKVPVNNDATLFVPGDSDLEDEGEE